jgi:hypothetical protein
MDSITRKHFDDAFLSLRKAELLGASAQNKELYFSLIELTQGIRNAFEDIDARLSRIEQSTAKLPSPTRDTDS